MTIGNSVRKTTVVWIAAGALLLTPSAARAHRFAVSNLSGSVALQDPQEAQDKEQERRDREQEARDREQEKRDREQEARDRAQEKLDRLQELYDDGRDDLDEDRYEKAEAKFQQLADMNGPQTDAALYWKAYAQNRLGKRDTALTTIADLKKRFPQSRWQKDAGALEIEVRQNTGNPSHPENQSDEELKMLALQGIMNGDPQKGISILENILNGSGTPKLKSRALFMAAQSGRPEVREILAKVARGQGNPELQRKAVEYLGIFGGPDSGRHWRKFIVRAAMPP
jgi:predicted Zn-dependent protease